MELFKLYEEIISWTTEPKIIPVCLDRNICSVEKTDIPINWNKITSKMFVIYL